MQESVTMQAAAKGKGVFMGNGVIGKILYFWIFILGGVFFAKILGFADDDKTTILFCVALAVAYVVFQVARTLGKRKRAADAAASRQPVRKGTAHKKKGRR